MTNSELNVITTVCEVLGIERKLLFSLNRKREIVEARMISAKLIYSKYPSILPNKEARVGKIFNKDRCAIIHYLKLHETLMDTCSKYKINYLIALNSTQTMVQFELIEEYNNHPQL